MKYKIMFIWALLLFSLSSMSAQMQSVTKVSDGVYEVVIDGTVMRAYTAEELRKKLLMMSDLKSHIEALEKLREAQQNMIEGQKEQLKRMEDQLADYRTLNTKLEQLLRLSPGFSTSVGLGYISSEATGMVGIGYGDWRLMGLLQQSSAGILISKDF